MLTMLAIQRSLAVTILVACVAMTVFSLASLVLPGTELLDDRPNPIEFLIFLTIFVTFPAVGLAVAWLRPGQPVGWAFLLVGLNLLLSVFATEYAGRVVYAGADFPAADVVAWAGAWGWVVTSGIALPIAIIMFPDGRLPSPRWRPFVWFAIATVALMLPAIAIDPRPLQGFDNRLANPFGVSGPIGDAAIVILELGVVPLLATPLIALMAIVARFRRSRGVEREQLKWLLYPAAIFLTGLVATTVTPVAEAWSVALFGLALVPIGVGIGILRHRLFDIDLVIRRTLTYGAVLVILGAVYVGLVLAFQSVLSGLIGGETLPVALSTLAIAALFGPVRARVRTLVDRRFYRSRYDRTQTLERFSGRLRDEVDLDAVARSLADVAGQTVRPASVGIWLRRRDAT